METIKKQLNYIIGLFIWLTRKVLGVFVKLQRKLMNSSYDKKIQHEKIIESTKEYDMAKSSDEPYYREQYWYWIEKHIKEKNLSSSGNYLDLGCGQGRMSIPLAQFAKQGKIIGVDISKHAILKAEEYAKEADVKNIEYKTGEILDYLKSCQDNYFDGILFLEVSFFMPEYLDVLKEIKRVLKSNGIVFASFRPKYFNALLAVKDNYINDFEMIMKKDKGNLFNGKALFTWQTSKDIKKLFEDNFEMNVLGLYAIGAVSGIEGDPHSLIARPSILDKEAKKSLMDLEINLAEYVPDTGRYMLCVAQKS